MARKNQRQQLPDNHRATAKLEKRLRFEWEAKQAKPPRIGNQTNQRSGKR